MEAIIEDDELDAAAERILGQKYELKANLFGNGKFNFNLASKQLKACELKYSNRIRKNI